MNDGEDWIMGPVDAGYLSYVELINSGLDLWDIQVMNDAIAVRNENMRRAREAAKPK
jgi:hypothetical protein